MFGMTGLQLGDIGSDPTTWAGGRVGALPLGWETISFGAFPGAPSIVFSREICAHLCRASQVRGLVGRGGTLLRSMVWHRGSRLRKRRMGLLRVHSETHGAAITGRRNYEAHSCRNNSLVDTVGRFDNGNSERSQWRPVVWTQHMPTFEMTADYTPSWHRSQGVPRRRCILSYLTALRGRYHAPSAPL